MAGLDGCRARIPRYPEQVVVQVHDQPGGGLTRMVAVLLIGTAVVVMGLMTAMVLGLRRLLVRARRRMLDGPPRAVFVPPVRPGLSTDLVPHAGGGELVLLRREAAVPVPTQEQLSALPSSGWSLLQSQDERGEFVAISHVQLGVLRRWRIDPDADDRGAAVQQVLADAQAFVGELSAR